MTRIPNLLQNEPISELVVLAGTTSYLSTIRGSIIEAALENK